MKWKGQLVGVDLRWISQLVEQSRDHVVSKAGWPQTLLEGTYQAIDLTNGARLDRVVSHYTNPASCRICGMRGEDKNFKRHFRLALSAARLRRQPLPARCASGSPSTRRPPAAAARSKAWRG